MSSPSPLERLLICSAGGMTLAVRVDAVLRIVRMATLSPVPGSSAAAGMLNLAGEVLPVVDPRVTIGLPSVAPHPGHYLVLVEDQSRYLVWVDSVERIVESRIYPAATLRDAPQIKVASSVTQIEGKVVPILDTRALDPSAHPDEIES